MNEMNDLSELEQHLRSWVPRRPCASSKRRLFHRLAGLVALASPALAAEAPASGSAPELPSFRLNWLAPGFAALLLTFVVFAQRSLPGTPSATAGNPMIAVALSNQSAAAWLEGNFSSSQNRVPAETFEWTNRTGRTSGKGAVLRSVN